MQLHAPVDNQICKFENTILVLFWKVFLSFQAQFIAQSIGQAFQVTKQLIEAFYLCTFYILQVSVESQRLSQNRAWVNFTKRRHLKPILEYKFEYMTVIQDWVPINWRNIQYNV